MAGGIWVGGASKVAQRDTFTPANVEIDDIFTLTATAEDGTTTASVSFTATAATVANVTAGLTAAWNASTNSLMTGITATDDTTSMRLDADVAGVPFYVASSTTDGGGTDDQTLTRAATTANSGPNDFNTALNWDGGAVPTNNDIVFAYGGDPLLYGLDQSAQTFTDIGVGAAYSGYIGDIANGYYLKVSAATNVRLSGNCRTYRLSGTFTSVYFTKGVGDANQAWLTGSVTNLYCTGSSAIGHIYVADSSTLTNVYMAGCPNCYVTVGSSIAGGVTLIYQTAGKLDINSSVATVNLGGTGRYKQVDGGITTKATNYGGTLQYNTSTTMASYLQIDGTLDLSESTAGSVTITAWEMIAGKIVRRSGLDNVSGGTLTQRGGTVVNEFGDAT